MFRSSYLWNFSAIATAVAVLGLATGASAQTNWTGAASSDWSDPANWDNGVPAATVDANINSAAVNPALNADGAAQNLVLGGVSDGHLTVDANTLSITNNIYLGRATGTTSTITQSGGAVSVGMIYGGSTTAGQTGAGTYTMTGGTLNVNILALGNKGTLTFTQSGGVVNNPTALWLGDAGWPGSTASTLGGPGSATYTLEGDAVYNGSVGDISYLAPWGGYGVLTVQGNALFNNHNVSVEVSSSTTAAGTGIINLHGNGQMNLTGVLTLAAGPLATGTLNQDGGVLTVPRIDKGLGAATHNFTGGTLNVAEVTGMDLVNGGGRVNVGGTGAATGLVMGLSGPVSNNIALGKTATQIGTAYAMGPERAVDGSYNNFCHTTNEANAWWQVDLTGDDSNASVHDIVLTARCDGYTYALSNFFVRVIDKDGSTVVWQDKFIEDPSELLGAGEDLVISLPAAVDGRYVQVQLDDHNLGTDPNYTKTLTITEVAVGDIARYGYSQTAGGTLGVELDPANLQCDKLVAGTVTLDGALDVTSLGADFAAGQVFDILDWSTLAGEFDTVNLPTLAGSLSWDTSKLYVTGELTVVPEPSIGILLLLGVLGLLVSARRR